MEAELIGAATVHPRSDDGYLVVGAGAIGCTVAAHLIREGHSVTLAERDDLHRASLAERGIVFAEEGDVAHLRTGIRPAAVLAPDEVHGTFRRVLLCVKTQDTVTASATVREHLHEDGFVVSCQNGDNEAVLIDVLGADRVVGAFVNIAADVVGPGIVRPGGVSELVVGELDGTITDRLRSFHADAPGLVAISTNVQGAIWSKRALAAMYTATALADDDTDRLIDDHRPLMRRLAGEVVAIAHRRGVVLEDLGYFAPARLVEDDDAATQELDRLIHWQHGIAKKRVGPFRDIAIRRRRTEAHSELADLAAAGHEVGSATPTLELLDRMLGELEDRTRAFTPSNLVELYRSALTR